VNGKRCLTAHHRNFLTDLEVPPHVRRIKSAHRHYDYGLVVFLANPPKGYREKTEKTLACQPFMEELCLQPLAS